MKTNVMIRIDRDVVQNAKDLDLNISKICESALLQAVEEENRPYEIVETSQIILEAELIYLIRDKSLGISFSVTNASEENVIVDRINYRVFVIDEEYLTDPDRQSIQTFKGTILDRRTLPKGAKDLFPEPLTPSPELTKRLSEVTHEDNKGLRWIIYPKLIADDRKRVLQTKFSQNWDEKKLFPIPRELKTM